MIESDSEIDKIRPSDEKHDVVYILGTGSKHNDLEILLSFISLHKYCTSWLRNVYVVGAKPRCDLSGFKYTYIPCADPYSQCKDANIIYKLKYAIEHIPDLSEDFLKCSDDQLVLENCEWDDLKPKKVMQVNFSDDDLLNGFFKDGNRKVKGWIYNLYQTLRRFKNSEKPVYYYEPHLWNQINKTKFLEMCKGLSLWKDLNIVIFTLYYNYIGYENPEKEPRYTFFCKNLLDYGKVFEEKKPKFVGYTNMAFDNKRFREELIKRLRK